MLAGDPASDGVLEYRGGVLYTEFGVAGLELGGRPSSFRWAGVRGMSERSSLGRTSGSSAKTMLISGTMTRVAYIQPLYCFKTGLTLVEGQHHAHGTSFEDTYSHKGTNGKTTCRTSPMLTRAAAL
jgi:hypothetical protein